jgi:5-methylcytosine-specific restriction endonuclease McrA
MVSNAVTRDIYRVLYEHRGTPLSIHDIRTKLRRGAGVQQHLDRRLRDLDYWFRIDRVRSGRATRYLLTDMYDEPRTRFAPVSKQDRAWALRDKRCVQCGRTPADDGVRLHVDHKIPQRWGGSNERENLQALCSECNEGKKDYYATFDEHSDAVLAAFTYDEPHKRIGEALKAAYPERLRSDLLERVACAKQYQEDWQKRLRELRLLGWKIKPSKEKLSSGRVISYYVLEEQPPEWPAGSIREAIRNEAQRRGY